MRMLYAMLVTIASCLHTGTVDTPLESHAHLYNREESGTVEWSRRAVDNLQVLTYERAKGRVLGYDSTTGRVFSQRKRTLNTNIITYQNAVILSLYLDKDSVWSLIGLYYNKLSSIVSDVAWRNVLPEPADKASYSWAAVLSKQPGGKHIVTLTSNRNHQLSCACRVVIPGGLAKNSGHRAITACMPHKWVSGQNSVHPKSQMDAIYHPSRHSDTKESHAHMCATLTNTLRRHKQIYIIPTQHLPTTVSKFRGGLKRHSIFHVTKHPTHQQIGRDTKTLPRAQIASDIKRVVGLVETVNTVLTRMQFIVTELLSHTLAFMLTLPNHEGMFSYLHTSSNPDESMRRRISEALSATISMHGGGDPAPLCSSAVDSTLADFLTYRKTFLTPESVNMTTIVRSASHYTTGHVKCFKHIANTLHRTLKCMISIETTFPSHTMEEVTTEGLFVNQLETALGEKHLYLAMQSGVSASEVADHGLKYAEDAAVAAFSATNRLSLLYAQLAPLLPTSNTSNQEMLTFSQRVWCCGLQSGTTKDILKKGDIGNFTLPVCKPAVTLEVERITAQLMNLSLY